jgi:hypothetical protein
MQSAYSYILVANEDDSKKDTDKELPLKVIAKPQSQTNLN